MTILAEGIIRGPNGLYYYSLARINRTLARLRHELMDDETGFRADLATRLLADALAAEEKRRAGFDFDF